AVTDDSDQVQPFAAAAAEEDDECRNRAVQEALHAIVNAVAGKSDCINKRKRTAEEARLGLPTHRCSFQPLAASPY
ncbi:hypothetical protein PMAYCL1PPCAC_10887, partial [Pristionchus mayeri]